MNMSLPPGSLQSGVEIARTSQHELGLAPERRAEVQVPGHGRQHPALESQRRFPEGMLHSDQEPACRGPAESCST